MKILLFSFILLLHAIYIISADETEHKILLNSVHYYGAKGDSISDDTKAIQKAIDSGIGQIIFHTGVFRITKSIIIDLNQTGPTALSGQGTATIIMEGPGPAFKFIGTHEGTASPGTVKPNVWKSQRMPIVDGLEIIGKHPKAIGIEATGTMKLTITRVLVREALHGIHLTKRNRNVIISECHLYNNRGIGIYLDEVNLHQINITNCHVSYNQGGGIVVRKGDVRNLQIGSCDIEGNMNEKGPATANIFIDITEGSMREGAIVGCTVQHGHNAPESANIRFIGHGKEDYRKVGNFTIADNVLSDTQQNLHILNGRGIIITGNTFWKGFTHNILIEQSEHIVFGSNILDRNPDYSFINSTNSVLIKESKNLTINGLHIYNITDEPAIVLERCQVYNLMNSTILNCTGGGIFLKDTENGKVSGNFINDDSPNIKNPVAIQIQGGNDNLIINNFTNGAINAEPNVAKIINNY